jgi:hypothetical protein
MTQPNENEALGTDEPCIEVNKIYLKKGESAWIDSPYGLVYLVICEKTGYPKIEIYGASNERVGVKYTKRHQKGLPLKLTPVARKNGDA